MGIRSKVAEPYRRALSSIRSSFGSVRRSTIWHFLLIVVSTGLFVWASREIPKMPRVLKLLVRIFNLLPSITGYLFVMVGIAIFLMPEELKKLEGHRKTRVVIALLLIVVGLGAVISDSSQKATEKATAQTERDKLSKQVGDLISQQGILVAQVNTLTNQSMPQLLGGMKNLNPKEEAKKRPDLHLLLVYPESVAVAIRNEKNAGVAYHPKYQLTLADLDNLDADLLKIPVQEGDFIRPGEWWGPTEALGLPAVTSVVKPGDRIFGYALVICPDCVKTRPYWVYIEQGKGGWYCEMPKPLFPYKREFYEAMKANLAGFLGELAPATCRARIENPK